MHATLTEFGSAVVESGSHSLPFFRCGLLGRPLCLVDEFEVRNQGRKSEGEYWKSSESPWNLTV
jgi:hypothetical protein